MCLGSSLGPLMESKRTLLRGVTICFVAFALALVLLPLIGSSKVGLARAWAGQSPDAEILFSLRFPRVLLAAAAGGALAVAGLLFQALLRDALADPYTLGISSGSALGAVIAICFRLPAVGLAALVGAAGVLAVVMTLASRGRRISAFTLLLAGVTVNSLSIAAVLFFHSMADFSQSFQIVRWLMGGIESVSYQTLALLAGVVIPATAFLIFHARDWNLLSMGEDWAEARGVAAASLLRKGFAAGALLTAAATCLTGPIGFIGWMVPHALRLWVGADHRVLIPCSFLAGAAYLALCDTIARTLLAPSEIPVGVITSLLGGPFFLWMLRRL